ncbi:MAG: type IX secretion system sortase PorU [Saprospiraceae bacterium]
MKKVIFFFFLISFLPANSQAQSFSVKKTINWDENPVIHNPTGNHSKTIWSFEGAGYSDRTPSLPQIGDQFQVSSYGELEVRVIDAQYESFDKEASQDDWVLSDELVFNTAVTKNRNDYVGQLQFIPIRKLGPNQFERLTSFELRVRFNPQPRANLRGDNTYTSVLSDGDVYKVSVEGYGIHKMTYSFLKDELGLDIDNIDPRKIKLYGNGGGSLPEPIATERIDDLKENSIWIEGGSDGSFDETDFILFYAEGPHQWVLNDEGTHFDHIPNVYDLKNYYFIKVESDNGLRVGDPSHILNSISSTSNNTNTYTDLILIGDEKYNLLFESPSNQGSGQRWLSEIFSAVRSRDFDAGVDDIVTGKDAHLKTMFAGRSPSSSRFEISFNGQTINSESIGSVNMTDAESLHARLRSIVTNFTTTSSSLNFTINYPTVGDGTNTGWLDYIQLNVPRPLTLKNNDLIFRDLSSINNNSTTYQLNGANSNTKIWDITDPLGAKLIDNTNLSGNTLSFGALSSELRTFIAFNTNTDFPSPSKEGEKLASQNYHGIGATDMVVIYHSDFEAAAQRFADHRSDHGNISIELVDVEKLYNEFSSGSKDPTAIRDFARMILERDDNFKYLLLFGDGSYDARNINGAGEDFVPVYETPWSFDPIESFPSDDYFALLSDDDGDKITSGLLDLAIGRFPVRTAFEAEGVVNKIIYYDTSKEVLGDWRNKIVFIADDEDTNTHSGDSDEIAEIVKDEQPILNIDKIYFDAYQQVPTSGGARYPKVQETINREIFKGVLALSYMGHGGGRGWAQERVLTNADIASWTNIDNMPLFVTATCSFAGYDEASYTSAGEQTFLKSDGGAIALFTTTRAVYTNSNKALNRAVMDTLFVLSDSFRPTMGEILRLSKNSRTTPNFTENSRKFTMLGDPSQYLAIPTLNIATTSINGSPLNQTPDTIRALQTVTISGAVINDNGSVITDFNGIVYPTIYDKEVTISTLGQDPGSPVMDFDLQRNIIFKGRASVTNGLFEFTFVVPKDINYEYGEGKISYYAEDGTQVDARGYSDRIVIGGTDPNGIQDDEGPLVEVYMNNEEFVSGGITDPNPTLLVKLSDDHGINVVGNSIGHDLSAILDQNTQNTYILNDFYESDVDDHTKGTVSFPLFDMEEGLHQVKVKAWDVANNSAEGYTEFLVTSGEDAALDHVLNYPNPFTTSTSFQFEHNMANQTLDVQVLIFTVSGKLAKTITAQVDAKGYRVTDELKWDGRDDYGDQLAKGVYLYKVKVNSLSDPTGESRSESDFEKLVILK